MTTAQLPVRVETARARFRRVFTTPGRFSLTDEQKAMIRDLDLWRSWDEVEDKAFSFSATLTNFREMILERDSGVFPRDLDDED